LIGIHGGGQHGGPPPGGGGGGGGKACENTSIGKIIEINNTINVIKVSLLYIIFIFF
jgi:hypothetical protein